MGRNLSKLWILVTAAIAALLSDGATMAGAAGLTILSAAGVSPVVKELGAQFEQTNKQKVALRFMDAPVVKRQIESGEPFDIAISVAGVIDDLIKQRKISADTRSDFVRAGMGVAVRSGVPKPDISNADAFKRALLNVKSVSYAAEGASGVYFTGLLDRLGIAKDMNAKLRPLSPPANVQAVAKGDVDMVVGIASPLLATPGIQFVGVLPPDLQTYLRFTIAVSATTHEPDVARALVHFFTSPGVASVIKARAMEPK